MELEEAESFLNDLFQELEDRPDLTNQKVLDRIIMRSCKSAVKGGDHLESAEIDALIRDLKKLRQSVFLSSWKTNVHQDDTL